MKRNIKEEIIKIRNLPSDFFNPSSNNINNPSLLKNIDKAKEIFINYVFKNKRITIVIDPDIDGVMATSIMYKWLINYNTNIKICHHQRDMGHGVIPNRIKPTDLLIIVDSSSNSINEVREIIDKKLAKDILIIDHHETNNIMILDGYITEYSNETGNEILTPNYEYEAEINTIKNVMLINPHQPDDEYPNKNISGAMLTLKFLEYIERELSLERYTQQLLDLSAISITSDVMNVSEMENRYYFQEGTKNINNPGLATLLNKMMVKCYNVSSDNIAFKLNKALNSTLRLQNILRIFDLILSYDSEEKDYMIEKILSNIKKRESIEIDLMDNIKELYNNNGIIIMQNTISKKNSMTNNFSGVIASKIGDKNSASVIVLDEDLKGSARAYKGFDFKEYVNNSDYASGIGHKGAFGVKINDLDKFIEYINNNPIEYEIDSEYEIELTLKDLTKQLFKDIQSLQFIIGNGFEKIKFKICDISISEIKQTTGGNTYYITESKQYIRFINKFSKDINIEKGNVIDVFCNISLNNYFGIDYYECSCYNIVVKDNKIDDNWGF